MGFWERATTYDAADDPFLDLRFFQLSITLYAHDLIDSSVFARPELALSAGELVEVDALLLTRPAGQAHLRLAWADRVTTAIEASRLGFPGLDSVALVKAALGVP